MAVSITLRKFDFSIVIDGNLPDENITFEEIRENCEERISRFLCDRTLKIGDAEIESYNRSERIV